MLKTIAAQALLVLVVLFSLAGFAGCGGCNMVATIPVDVSIPIHDPTFARLAVVSDKLELVASGRLKGGRYVIKSMPLDVPDGTEFKLSFWLPLHGSPVINIREATGVFSSTRELKAFGAPVPTKIEFVQGKLSGDLQFVRALCALLIELVNEQINPTRRNMHDVAGMVSEIRIQTLRLALRPDSRLDMPGVQLAIGPGSAISLSDVKVDQQFNYSGHCQSKINLRSGSRFSDEKKGLVIELGAGSLSVNLSVTSADGVLAVRTEEIDGAGNEIAVQPLVVNARRAGALCVLNSGSASVKSLHWSESRRIGSDAASIDVTGEIALSAVNVALSKPDSAVKFSVPKQVTLSVDFHQSDREKTFRIGMPADIGAENIELAFIRPDGKISVELKRATVGCSISSTPELIDITLPKGELEPRRLTWDRGDRKIVIAMPEASKLSLTSDVRIALDPTTSALQGTIPILVKGGTTIITEPQHSWTLDGINGNLTLEMKSSATTISGKLTTTIEERSEALGGVTKCGVRVGSIRISSDSGHLRLELGGCRLSIPRAVLVRVICAKLPQKRSFEVNKEILQNSRWRYRNLIVREAQVSHLKLQQFRFSGPSTLSFQGSADVLATGTVERSSSNLLSLLQNSAGADSWSQHPWSANAHVTGAGAVSFNLVPGNSLAESSVAYNAIMQMAVPDDLNLNWTNVCPSGDVLARAETAMVRGALKMADFCIPQDELSLKRAGTFNLFSKPSQQLRAIKLEHPVVKAVGDYLTIEFGSHVEL